MLNKKTKNRSFLFFLFFLFLIIFTALTLKTLEDNVLYFFSPTDIQEKQNIDFDKKMRIGGMVKKQSIIGCRKINQL